MSSPNDNSSGQAGGSAHREYERRKDKRETYVKEHHPHLGGVILALQEPPQEETRWERGAVGEQRVAAILAKKCPEAIILNDRRIPPGRGNIDHIAISASGVWVIDAKRYKGEITVEKKLFKPPRLRSDS